MPDQTWKLDVHMTSSFPDMFVEVCMGEVALAMTVIGVVFSVFAHLHQRTRRAAKPYQSSYQKASVVRERGMEEPPAAFSCSNRMLDVYCLS